MAEGFNKDILLQAEDIEAAAAFYRDALGFAITARTDTLVTLLGPSINLFIDRGPALGPVLEVKVPNVQAAKADLVKRGAKVLREEPEVPRCYVRDPFGLTYNLAE